MVAANTGDLQKAVDDWALMAEDGLALGADDLMSFGYGGVGYGSLGMGRLVEAGPPLDEALRYAERCGNDFLIALWRTVKGMQLFATGDAAGGAALVGSARRIQVRIGDFEGGGMALSFLASMAFSGGDLVRTLALYRESEAAFATVGDKPELARVQCETGYAALAADDLTEARRCFERALRTNNEVGSPRGTGQALLGLAATAQVMSAKAGVVVAHPMAPGVAERIEALRASIPKQELDALVASGSAMSPAAVLALIAG